MKGKIVIPLLCFAIAVGMLSGCVEQTVNVLPEANFTYEPMEIYPETEITFTDTSTDEDGTVAVWLWDFGDDTDPSADQNPTHTYDAVGTYTVSLTVTDDSEEESTAYTTDIIVTYVPPTADFNYTPMVNITNATEVTFTDISTIGDANITAWSWDFDADGVEDANETTATYIFTEIGDHEVTLIVTDANEMTGTETKTITVIEVIAE